MELARAGVDLNRLDAQTREEVLGKLTAETQKHEELLVAKQKLVDAQKAVNDANRFFGDTAADALEDLIINGEKAEDVLKNVVKQLAKAALQASSMGTGPLAGLFGGGKGLLGSLFSGSFGGTSGGAFSFGAGGYTGMGPFLAGGGKVSGPGTGTSDSILAHLSDGEYVVNAAATKKYGALLAAINSGTLPRFSAGGPVGGFGGLSVPSVPSGGGGGGGLTVHFNPTIDARGATTDALPALRAEMASLKAQLPSIIMQTNGEARRRGAMR